MFGFVRKIFGNGDVRFWRDKAEEAALVIYERDKEIANLKSQVRLLAFDKSTAETNLAETRKKLQKQNNYANAKYRQKNAWKEVAFHLDPELERNPNKYHDIYKAGYNKSTSEYPSSEEAK